MAYRGKFKPQLHEKYEGDATNVIYRSLWERGVFKWCDRNKDVVKWSSEEVVVPYRCKTDNKQHRYFVDIKITFSSGEIYLIEIKPEKYTKKPTAKRKTKRFLKECFQYAKNTSKWNAAEAYAESRGWHFEIWTEKTLKDMGIRIVK